MTQMPPLQPYWLIARVMMTCYGQIMKYATIMQRLACCMVKGQDHGPGGRAHRRFHGYFRAARYTDQLS